MCSEANPYLQDPAPDQVIGRLRRNKTMTAVVTKGAPVTRPACVDQYSSTGYISALLRIPDQTAPLAAYTDRIRICQAFQWQTRNIGAFAIR